MNKNTKSSRVSLVKQLIEGTKKHYPDGSALLQVGGASFTVTALTQLMQDFVDGREAVEEAQATARAKVQAEQAKAPSQFAVITAFETLVRGAFGAKADVLADFGLAPPKTRTPLTAEQKAVAAAKRKATRQARGTMGKVQKKNVKGAVTATLVVTPLDGSKPAAGTPAPVTAPAAAPAPAPAQATAPAPAAGATPHAS